MDSSVSKLAAIANAVSSTTFNVPLVYVKGKLIMTLNTSNTMHYKTRMRVKDNYKASIYDIVASMEPFTSDHVHLIFEVHYSDKRSRDNDNNIYITKWFQDAMVEHGKLGDDKYVSFTFLPAIYDKSLDEHFCKITCLDLEQNDYFNKLRILNEE